MLIITLANSGTHLELPHAVDCVTIPDTDKVAFVDEAGRELVILTRSDVAMFMGPIVAKALGIAVTTEGLAIPPHGEFEE